MMNRYEYRAARVIPLYMPAVRARLKQSGNPPFVYKKME